jgi:hypothetical protein
MKKVNEYYVNSSSVGRKHGTSLVNILPLLLLPLLLLLLGAVVALDDVDDD